jgi:hypothetical protein
VTRFTKIQEVFAQAAIENEGAMISEERRIRARTMPQISQYLAETRPKVPESMKTAIPFCKPSKIHSWLLPPHGQIAT